MYSVRLVILVTLSFAISSTIGNEYDSVLCSLEKLNEKLAKLDQKVDEKFEKLEIMLNRASRIRDPSTLEISEKKAIKGFDNPLSVHVADDGIAYFTEYSGRKLHKLDSQGNVLKSVSLDDAPMGIYVKGKRVFVAQWSKGIVEYTTNLDEVGIKIRSEQITRGVAAGVAVDSDGKVYVSGHSTGIVHVYNKDGSKSHDIQVTESSGKKTLKYFRFDPSENFIYVPSRDEGAVFVFTKEGNFVNKFTVDAVVESAFVDDNGNIYAAGDYTGTVFILNSSGEIIKNFKPSGVRPSDAVIAPDGTLWVVDAYSKICLY